MKKLNLLLLLICSIYVQVNAQGDWLYPVSFPNTSQICDTSPWKLIFFDDFNGNSLDSTKWITYGSWKGMPKLLPGGGSVIQDHENWLGARYDFSNSMLAKQIYRKENIEVSNGMVKLWVRHKPNEWHCDTCTLSTGTQYYTGAWLATYYNYQYADKSFNNGKFELRAKFPDFTNAFGTIWTWYGTYAGVNEIDIAESSGALKYSNYNIFKKDWRSYVRTIMHPTHAWPANTVDLQADPLPYHKEDDVTQDVKPYYPMQNWWNYFIFNNDFDFTQWHVYTCEWDSTVVRTYLDHMKVHTLFKYYTPVNVLGYTLKLGAPCLVSGTWQVSRGFPYRTSSASQLRITSGVQAGSIEVDKSNNIYDMGYTALDYVKIWQRHPELDGFTELCNQPVTPVSIVGVNDNSDFVCGSKKFTTSPLSTGTWSLDNDAFYIQGSNTASQVSVVNNANTAGTQANLQFSYGPAGCPPYTATRNLYQQSVNTKAMVTAVNSYYNSSMRLYLQAAAPVTAYTYEWEVWYGPSSTTTQYLHAYGSTIVTPQFAGQPYTNNPPYYVKWRLKVHTPCGTEIRESEKRQWQPFTAQYSMKNTYMDESGDAYLGAVIATEDDYKAYDSEVAKGLGSRTIDPEQDSVSIYSMIRETQLDCLAPYLYFTDKPEVASATVVIKPVVRKQTRIFPNPAGNYLNIEPGQQFKRPEEERVLYTISDTKGTVVMKGNLQAHLPVAKLLPGVYFLQLIQGSLSEQLKFEKR